MLFGGLFAGYVFLRLGALPGTWPSNVQMVEPGLLNTAILIISSVTVVLAWASVKLNHFRNFKIFMGITLLCSLLFLGFKAVEYNKKFHHYGAYLRDDRDPKGWSIQVTGHRLPELEDEKHYVLQADPARKQPWHWHSAEVDGEYIYPVEQFDRFDFQHAGVTLLPSDTAGHGKKHGAADKHGGHGAGEYTAHGPVLKIAKDQVFRFLPWVPAYNSYFAIYFTMTGLHALHVIGGFIVLLYFWWGGKDSTMGGARMFFTDRAHFANRIEVGGLFWHFVDLVWIFLFPIMYLM
jgi:cytochrome c oxidase subunit III